ncbi:hypothetical protein DDE83_000117 [Stemphylium lycopersici]|uniref:Uncharacterized protein n=1 Tax=Stemphylium lycopersici TaxID=183478 RepID=A0A364NH11_STELY|nr:hypothetical protein DDE83_000117 [Stemphylium lycopersici]
MTPRTRNSNRDTNLKVYYSKKVAQQVHFSHKRKTVRRRSTPVHDGDGRRQMVFLPEKMRRRSVNTVDDSDGHSEDLEEDLEGEGVPLTLQADHGDEQDTTNKTKRKGRKLDSDSMQEHEDSQNDDLATHTSKRQRKNISPKNRRRTGRVKAEPDNAMNEAHSPSREHALRRQSTMTQLRDGRRPQPGSEEPEFRPVKRSPRLSRGGKGKIDLASRDKRQRTLTQMVPGMRPLEILSEEDTDDALSDTENEERGSQAYGDAVAQRLAQQGLYRAEKNNGREMATAQAETNVQPTMVKTEEEDESTTSSQGVPESVLQSVEADCEDSYRPTQFIDAPFRRTGRPTRKKATAQAIKTEEASYVPQRARRPVKARFSLLSTPEKRRIREIPSSQSPADSPLSTQVTPHKFKQSPLKECSDNSINVADTPSKRKQVTFKMPSKTPIPPPRLKKFESIIQDSEDEGDDIIEDVPLGEQGKRTLPESAAIATSSQVLGADTHAMFGQIDQACDDADINGDVNGDVARSQSSQESGSLPALRGHKKPSPELGESHEQSYSRREWASNEEHQKYDTVLPRIKQEPGSEDEGDDDATVLPCVQSPHEGKPFETDITASIEADLPMPAEQLCSTRPILEANIQDTFPSTPMVIQDDSSDEEIEPEQDPTPPRSSRQHPSSLPKSNRIQQSAGLDEGAVQVPRSPSPQHETQQSHSSKAEQQLHDEWFSYSQYIQARPLESPSVRAAPDAFSYNETPRPPHRSAPPPQHQPPGYHPSQATTVDEITQRTPRTKRTQHFSSTHTTPHRVASSQPAISPSKPPPLLIPSSFPSPEKVGMEGWSSPVLETTQAGGGYMSSQWASLENFSIPLPPPVDDEDDGE